jgi:carbon-monoxide dehydrogenase iron sulfur subunit
MIIISFKTLMVESSQCTGCRTCEMACSLYHEGQCSPVLSRVRIIKYESLGKNFPSVCSQCSKPQCLKACDQGAITIDEKTRSVAIDQSKCTGCRSCLTVCPHIGFHPMKRVAFKCDLCQGSPQCARFCPSGALIFSRIDEHLMARQRALADRAILAAQE